MHAKTVVADGHVSLVGSANMDMRSFRLNFEVHALVHDAATASSLCRAFAGYEGDTRRVDLADWSRRPWKQHLKEGAARLVSPML